MAAKSHAGKPLSIYSIDVLIAETRRLAAEFRRTTGQMLPVSAEIARYDVAHHLKLTLNEQHIGGIDAVGTGEREGLKVQIKGRVILDEGKSGHRIGQINPDGNWDLIVLCLMDADFEPYEMYEASKQEILDSVADSKSNSGKRGAMSVAKFKIIGTLVWTREDGEEPGVWNIE